MRRTSYIPVVAALALSLGCSAAQAAVIDLYDWGFNLDGTTYLSPATYSGPGALPGNINAGAFGFSSGMGTGGGLGTVTITITGAGNHSVDAFFDHEIDEAVNTYFNEYGVTGGGALAAGQSYEIDEPGWVFGDIYDNFVASTLDNSNAVPSGSEDDVSMALGWDFSLLAGETATIQFFLSSVAPNQFFLAHIDPDSDSAIYFSSTLVKSGGTVPDPSVPEPGTLLLMGAGLAGLAGASRRGQTPKAR